MVFGHSSPCSRCSPHPQRMVWGSCRDLRLRQQWQGMVLGKLCPNHSFALGSANPAQLLSIPCCWPTQYHLQTAPALGKGQMVHRGERRTWALAVEERHQDWHSTQERPWCRHGWACQADRERHRTPITIPWLYPNFWGLGVITHKAPLKATQVGACRCRLHCLTQLWCTAWRGTDLHNSSSEADRYYNQQIMITSILQAGIQWPHESSPSDRMNQTLNDSEKLEVPGIEAAGVHHTEAAVSALSKWFTNNCFNCWTAKKSLP